MALIELSAKQRLAISAHIVFQQLLAVFILSVIWLMYANRDWTVLGTWHIFLCVVGFAFFMTEAVMVFNSSNIFTIGIKKVFKGYIHGTFMFLACVCVTIGISLKIKEKADRGTTTHFTSTHAKLGLTAWILTLTAVGGGFVVQITRNIRFIRPVIIKLIHVLVGVSAYVIGNVAIGYGLNSYFGLTEKTAVALQVVLGLYVGYSLIGPVMSIYSYLKNIFSSGK